MRRLKSVISIIFIIMMLCTTVFAANPTVDLTIRHWALSDNGSNIGTEILQFPKLTWVGNYNHSDRQPINEARLQEVIIKVDLDLSGKYLQSFKDGNPIPELVLCGVNISSRPVFKIKLENCIVSGFTITGLESGYLSEAVKAVIKLSAARVTTTNLSTPEGSIIVNYGQRLDTAKLFINGAECSGNATLSEIEGYKIVSSSAGQNTYAGTGYKSFEMALEYDKIGTLPNWLASFDGGFDYTVNPECRLRYELSNSRAGNSLSFEADLKAVGQELTVTENMNRMCSKYTFQVYDISFIAPAAAADTPSTTTDTHTAIDGSRAAAADITPINTANPIIRGSNLGRMLESTWAGKWITTFGSMTQKQDGTKVMGEYGNPVETLEGTVSGSKLAGTWRDSVSSGKFEFTMSADGKSFSGFMYNQILGDKGTFEWNGSRE
ncbi:MAG TPA: hypothetical protein VD757_00785 [Candidatus Nitrosocosmicus sp.]|nr:hypothetical protein [Candidatus Nitrosocosmicus sp.]